jgi:hypothetical protein
VLPFSKGVNETPQVVVRTRRCGQTDNDGHQETGRPSKDCRPEVLGHIARIGVNNGDPASFESGRTALRNGQALVDGSGVASVPFVGLLGSQPGNGLLYLESFPR